MSRRIRIVVRDVLCILYLVREQVPPSAGHRRDKRAFASRDVLEDLDHGPARKYRLDDLAPRPESPAVFCDEPVRRERRGKAELGAAVTHPLDLITQPLHGVRPRVPFMGALPGLVIRSDERHGEPRRPGHDRSVARRECDPGETEPVTRYVRDRRVPLREELAGPLRVQRITPVEHDRMNFVDRYFLSDHLHRAERDEDQAEAQHTSRPACRTERTHSLTYLRKTELSKS